MSLGNDILAKLGVIVRAVDEWRKRASLASVMAHPAADPCLSIDEAALYASLCPKTLKSDALAGQLATLQRTEGGRVRVRLSDLNAYLSNQRRAASAAGKTSNTDHINWDL